MFNLFFWLLLPFHIVLIPYLHVRFLLVYITFSCLSHHYSYILFLLHPFHIVLIPYLHVMFFLVYMLYSPVSSITIPPILFLLFPFCIVIIPYLYVMFFPCYVSSMFCSPVSPIATPPILFQPAVQTFFSPSPTYVYSRLILFLLPDLFSYLSPCFLFLLFSSISFNFFSLPDILQSSLDCLFLQYFPLYSSDLLSLFLLSVICSYSFLLLFLTLYAC